MNKILTISAFVASVFAGKQNFPGFDMFHANCALQVTYPTKNCATVFAGLESAVKSFNPEPLSKGLYSIKEEATNDYLWTIRETPTHHYKDDIIFELKPSGNSCIVNSKSRSESPSVYDYETNYCNQWTVHQKVGGF